MSNIDMMGGFMVYWMDISGGEFFPFHSHFTMDEMTEALAFMEELRSRPENAYVGMISQNPDHVGKVGASTVLPEDYAWSKQYRGSENQTKVKSLMGGRSQE